MPRLINIIVFAVAAVAIVYIIRLRRELAVARDRGDMYRDIAASLDRQQAI
jgi:preprotein translocase subunit SecY